MERDSQGRFLPKPGALPLPAPGALQGELIIRLLVRIAYNTAQTHLNFGEYCRQVLARDVPYAHHSAAE